MTDESDLKRAQIEVLGLAEGFYQSNVLFALLKLGVIDQIGHDGSTADELATRLGVHREPLRRLLAAGVVLRILRRGPEETFRLTPAYEAVLLRDSGRYYLGDWVRNLSFFAEATSMLDRFVREDGPTVDPLAHIGGDPELTEQFALAMQNYAALRGKEFAQYLDTRGCETLLDLGCGPGTYAFQLGEANPDLHLFLLDLPNVLEQARAAQSSYDLRNEITYLPIDVVREEIPGAYDIVVVSNTLHMLGEEDSRALLKRLYPHVNPGGSLVVQAQFLHDHRMGPRWPVFLDITLGCVTTRGRNHSMGETQKWMEDAGFTRFERCSMSLMNTNSFIRGWRE